MSDTNNNIKVGVITDLKWERGSTPDDIKSKCFQLCVDYLGGVWCDISIDDIEVRRLSGGLTNQLYYCALNEDLRNSDENEPKEVAIRLYQDKHFNNWDNEGNERLTDVIIALIMSEKNLGPKIYGLFESGQIMAYYQHKCFRSEEQKDPKLVQKVAQKLARIHSTVIPIKKKTNFVFNFFDKFYAEAYKLFDIKSLIDECNCEALKAHDLKEELEWLKETIIKTDSPVTFAHIDFRGSNIMVTESNDIMLCDFEYSCNEYRGWDFGTLFTEWGGKVGEFNRDIPDNEIIRPFIEWYIEESVKIFGNKFTNDKRNSFEHISQEVKVFSLVTNMFYLLYALKMDKHPVNGYPFNKKEAMIGADMMYKQYFQRKHKFIEDKVIN